MLILFDQQKNPFFGALLLLVLLLLDQVRAGENRNRKADLVALVTRPALYTS